MPFQIKIIIKRKQKTKHKPNPNNNNNKTIKNKRTKQKQTKNNLRRTCFNGWHLPLSMPGQCILTFLCKNFVRKMSKVTRSKRETKLGFNAAMVSLQSLYRPHKTFRAGQHSLDKLAGTDLLPVNVIAGTPMKICRMSWYPPEKCLYVPCLGFYCFHFTN